MHHWQCLYTSKVHKKQPFWNFHIFTIIYDSLSVTFVTSLCKMKEFFSIGKTFICTVGVNIKYYVRWESQSWPRHHELLNFLYPKYRWLSEASNSLKFHFQRMRVFQPPIPVRQMRLIKPYISFLISLVSRAT